MIDCLLRKASPLLNMAEQSDAFKQLDAVGKSRYNEKLGMLGITTDPYMTPKDAWDYNPSCWPDVSFPDICVFQSYSFSKTGIRRVRNIISQCRNRRRIYRANLQNIHV